MDLKRIEKYIQKQVDSNITFPDFSEAKIPFTTLDKPISEAKVALISSGGFYKTEDDTPFDTEDALGEASFRRISRDATMEDLSIAHTHYDHKFVEEDLNAGLPLELLSEMAEEGLIGELSETNYSFSGYLLRFDEMLNKLAPQIAGELKGNQVDAVILSPM